MRYYSTRNKNDAVNFAAAALAGLAPDGGLFVPEEIPRYSPAVLSSLGTMDYRDIAFETIKPYVQGEIPDAVLEEIVQSAYPFSAPLVSVSRHLVLELFHGPTAAFKDFGARFMARAFAYLRRGEDKPLHILVATSGDTGGAVADGFFEVPGISVTVLYPKGRITPLQERQIAGLGKNISALAVEGSFDDCQRLVKAALANDALKKKMSLSSANSINISRLIPQAVYYAAAAGRAFAGLTDPDGDATPRSCKPKNFTTEDTEGKNRNLIKTPCASVVNYSSKKGIPITLCVPSGNFGNLTAGLYAMKMGAPIQQFIAATNINKTVPDYLASGEYHARTSQATISNAMDVGAPSNFERMAAHWAWDTMRQIILGVSVSDEETRQTIVQVHNEAGYFLDPHSAVAWKGLEKLAAENKIPSGPAGILSTAHPAKFSETVEPLLGPIPVPASLASAMKRSAHSQTIPAEEAALFAVL
ncbi:MAG: threonine synthase [Treponema sp.]|jgi:threonine synthase|nr:threonine synthase [Treponema sp.]